MQFHTSNPEDHDEAEKGLQILLLADGHNIKCLLTVELTIVGDLLILAVASCHVTIIGVRQWTQAKAWYRNDEL